MELHYKFFVWGLVKTSVCKCLVRATEKYKILDIIHLKLKYLVTAPFFCRMKRKYRVTE